MKADLLNYSKAQLADVVAAVDGRPYVVTQLYEWVYQKGVADFARMSNLASTVRALLAERYCLSTCAPVHTQVATDGTRKFFFRLHGGAAIETVLIAMGGNRRTLCISTQVGCAMGCKFCRTATMGLVRHLTQGEILQQVLDVRRLAADEPFTNIVLMGMGEPLHNYDAVVGALRILVDPHGMGFSKRHVTLSTVGLVPAIRRLAGEGLGIKLALSLHATTDALRRELIPMAKKYPLTEVLDACRAYSAAVGPRHRVTFEYLLIKDVNDSAADAKRLVEMVSHAPSKVNVIPLNPYPGCPWERPTEEGITAFVERLRAKHVQVNIRVSRGQEILAACGQLAIDSHG